MTQTYGIMYLDSEIGGYVLKFIKAQSIEKAKAVFKKYFIVQAYCTTF